MIVDLIAIVVIMAGGCFVAISVWENVKSETTRALVVVGYGLLTLFLLSYWFLNNLNTL